MFKVMTLNVNYFMDRYGPWQIRKELVCEAIRAVEPDAIALQAVRCDPAVHQGLDQASQLATLLPEYRQVLFQPAIEDFHGIAEGSALVACSPWRETGSRRLTLLPGLDDQNQRVVLAAIFDLGEHGVNLFNAHFSWVHEQARLNLSETLTFICPFSGPGMLVGDLNAPPDSDLWQPLIAAGWTDVWAALYPDQPGYTFVEGDRLSKRIDYVWVNEELRPYVRDIEVVATGLHPSGARASDHAGLLVTFDY
jgi:endonuclease/exonuclease/phosphatase family metal-dependent hydrolase